MKKIMNTILDWMCKGIINGIAGAVIAYFTVEDIVVHFREDYHRFGPMMFFMKRYWYCKGFF